MKKYLTKKDAEYLFELIKKPVVSIVLLTGALPVSYNKALCSPEKDFCAIIICLY